MQLLNVFIGFAALAAAMPKQPVVTVTSTSTTTVTHITFDRRNLPTFTPNMHPSPTVEKRGGFDFKPAVFELVGPSYTPNSVIPSGAPSVLPYDGMPVHQVYYDVPGAPLPPPDMIQLHREPAKIPHDGDIIDSQDAPISDVYHDVDGHHNHDPLVFDEDAPEETMEPEEEPPAIVARNRYDGQNGEGRRVSGNGLGIDHKQMSDHELKEKMWENLKWDGTCEDNADLCEGGAEVARKA